MSLAVTWVFGRGLRVASAATTALRFNQIRIVPQFGIGPGSNRGYQIATDVIQRGCRRE